MQSPLSRAFCLLTPVGLALATSVSASTAQTRSQVFLNDTIVVQVSGDGPFLNPVLGDANGDGVPDLLAVRRGTNEVGALLSTGRARWADTVSLAHLPGGALVQDIAPADVNNDGNVDLAYWARSAVGNGLVFGVLLGDGEAGLTPANQVISVVPDLNLLDEYEAFDTIDAADVTGDGLIDLVVASGALVVLEGDGAGNFMAPVVIENFQSSLELVDIDGDGIAEVASAGPFGLTVQQRVGDEWILVANDPLGAVFFEISGLVATERCEGSGGIQLFATDGSLVRNGSIQSIVVTVDFEIIDELLVEDAGRIASIITADVLDGPGAELLSATGAVYEYPACGGTTNNSPIDELRRSVVAIADVDIDGDADIVTASLDGIAISIVESDGVTRNIAFDLVVEIESPVFTGNAPGIAAGDFDGDGRIDVFVSTDSNPASAVFYRETDGSYTTVLLPETARSPRTHAADLDDDGLDDAVLITSGVNVQVNFAEPGRAFAPRLGFPVGATPREARTGDVDGDGDLDIIAQTTDGFAVLRQTKPRQFDLSYSGLIPDSQLGLAVGDLNGDGVADVVVGSASDFGVQVAFSHGDGTFGPAMSIDQSISVEALELADIDNDDDLDIAAIALNADPSGAVYENDGAGGFTKVAEIDARARTTSGEQWIEVGDINGDGNADIVLANREGIFEIFSGDGDFNFVSNVTVAVDNEPHLNQFVLEDLDADGFLDAAVVQFDQRGFGKNFGGIRLLTNRHSASDICPADLAPPAGTLDLADITLFVNGFQGVGDEAAADLAAPFGTLDLADIAAFMTVFVNGCG